MTKLMTISSIAAAVLSVAIATNANAFPHRGLAFAHGRAAAFHHGGVWRGAGWRGGAVAVGAAGGFGVGTAAGATVAWPYGPYVAPAPGYASPPGVYAGGTVIGGAYGYGRRAFMGGGGRFVGARGGHLVGARGARFRR